MTAGGKDETSAAQARKARLAAELRANLKRRKARQRAADAPRKEEKDNPAPRRGR